MTPRRAFVMPTIILLIFAGSLVIASALQRSGTQQLIVQQQVESYHRHHDVQGARAVIRLWLSRQGLRDLSRIASPETSAHRFELPGGRRIVVFLIDGQGLAKADVRNEPPANREAFEKYLLRIPANRPELFRRLGPPQISVNSAPVALLESLAPDGSDLGQTLSVARARQRLDQASMRQILVDTGYDNEKIAEILRLVAFEPTFLRMVVEVEDKAGVMRFASYIDAGGVNASRPQLVEWREVDDDEAAALLGRPLTGPTENAWDNPTGRGAPSGGVGQGARAGRAGEQR